jgi:hypothetical protein
MYLAGMASADPGPVDPPKDIDCTVCECIYVKGWWAESDGKYRAICPGDTKATAIPDWTGESLQSYDCPKNGVVTTGPTDFFLWEFDKGNNTCNKLKTQYTSRRIKSTVSAPNNSPNKTALAYCKDGNGKIIPYPPNDPQP